jgi:hypothetical protein
LDFQQLLAKLETTLLEAQTMSQTVEKLRQKRQRMAALRLRVLGRVDRLLSTQTPVRPEEMAVRARLAKMLEEIRHPGVSLSAQLAEIESLRHIQVSSIPFLWCCGWIREFAGFIGRITFHTAAQCVRKDTLSWSK